jgi:hypothetical protein
MDGKINRISPGILSNLEGKTIIESSFGFILTKDDDNHITITADKDNITANTVKLNYITKVIRDEDDLLMYACDQERFVYYNGIVYKYKGSVPIYEGFFIDSRLVGSAAVKARKYYQHQLTDTLRFCQDMIISTINKITIPLDILTCVDYITALSKVPI